MTDDARGPIGARASSERVRATCVARIRREVLAPLGLPAGLGADLVEDALHRAGPAAQDADAVVREAWVAIRELLDGPGDVPLSAQEDPLWNTALAALRRGTESGGEPGRPAPRRAVLTAEQVAEAFDRIPSTAHRTILLLDAIARCRARDERVHEITGLETAAVALNRRRARKAFGNLLLSRLPELARETAGLVRLEPVCRDPLLFVLTAALVERGDLPASMRPETSDPGWAPVASGHREARPMRLATGKPSPALDPAGALDHALDEIDERLRGLERRLRLANRKPRDAAAGASAAASAAESAEPDRATGRSTEAPRRSDERAPESHDREERAQTPPARRRPVLPADVPRTIEWAPIERGVDEVADDGSEERPPCEPEVEESPQPTPAKPPGPLATESPEPPVAKPPEPPVAPRPAPPAEPAARPGSEADLAELWIRARPAAKRAPSAAAPGVPEDRLPPGPPAPPEPRRSAPASPPRVEREPRPATPAVHAPEPGPDPEPAPPSSEAGAAARPSLRERPAGASRSAPSERPAPAHADRGPVAPPRRRREDPDGGILGKIRSKLDAITGRKARLERAREEANRRLDRYLGPSDPPRWS